MNIHHFYKDDLGRWSVDMTTEQTAEVLRANVKLPDEQAEPRARMTAHREATAVTCWELPPHVTSVEWRGERMWLQEYGARCDLVKIHDDTPQIYWRGKQYKLAQITQNFEDAIKRIGELTAELDSASARAAAANERLQGAVRRNSVLQDAVNKIRGELFHNASPWSSMEALRVCTNKIKEIISKL